MLTLPVVIDTLTGAWSRLPIAAGSVGTASTAIVGGFPFWPGVATELTCVIRPGVVRSFGSVIVTGSPALTWPCSAGSSWIWTCRAIPLAVSTGPAATVAPTATVDSSDVTRIGPGSNTTEPISSCPVAYSLCATCSRRIAAAVAAVNASPVRPCP